MSISQFSAKINLPICQFMNEFSRHKTKVNEQQKQSIKFLSGDPTVYGMTQFRMPEEGYEILRKHTRIQANHGYTASNGTLNARQAVLKLYKPKIQVDPSKVFINHGVNMGLLSTLMSFTNPGDQILVPEMGYPFFTDVCPSMNVTAVEYKLLKQKNFQIDLQYLKTLITQKTQFIFIINPSNPMGTIFSKQHMQEILRFCDENQLPIVADEVYLRQGFQGREHFSFGEMTEDVPVIALCGLEKVFSVPGWCTSWTVVFDKNGYLNTVFRNIATLCTIFLHTNRFTQQSLDDLVTKVGLFTHEKMHLIKKRHDYAYKKAIQLQLSFIKPLPAHGTIYLALQIDFTCLTISNDKQFVYKFLQEQNVSVLPISVFGKGFEGLRLITCADEKVYDQFFKRLGGFVRRYMK